MLVCLLENGFLCSKVIIFISCETVIKNISNLLQLIFHLLVGHANLP